MPDQEQEKQNFFAFRMEKWEDIVAALEEAMKAKENLLNLGEPMMNKIFARLIPIHRAARDLNPNNFVDMIDKELTRFLSPDIIRYVIESPKDEVVRGLLSMQLYLVAVATGNLATDNIAPYTLDEFKEVVVGAAPYYDDVIFLHTLRRIILNEEEDERCLWLLNSLPTLNEEGGDIKKYSWEDALVFSVVLQAVWKYFGFLGVQSQQFLLQNYLYQAIVAGVPVSFWLEQFFKNIGDEKDFAEAIAVFLKSIDSNREEAIVDLETAETRKLAAIVKEYNTRIYNSDENIVILAKEKFIADIYKNQPLAESLGAWLRGVLNIVIKLRRKEFV